MNPSIANINGSHVSLRYSQHGSTGGHGLLSPRFASPTRSFLLNYIVPILHWAGLRERTPPFARAKEQYMSSAVTTQIPELENYVNGAWRRASASEYAEVTNPATTELLARTPLSSSADVEAAVQAAAAAFPAWRRTPPGERVQYLFKLKNLLEENLDELSRIITIENGKTFGEAKAELRRSIENVEVACGIPMMMQGYNLEDVTPGVDEMQIRQPLGVVAAIVPFNFPAMVSYWFLPYAIACGNTFILKPSERVPLSMRRAFELLEKTGLPKGVVNLVNGG
jgi:malonate-semialdehyde dehydrogenase (acetylating)/methylmalonate-semialdehyde dehydrogenase